MLQMTFHMWNKEDGMEIANQTLQNFLVCMGNGLSSQINPEILNLLKINY